MVQLLALVVLWGATDLCMGQYIVLGAAVQFFFAASLIPLMVAGNFGMVRYVRIETERIYHE